MLAGHGSQAIADNSTCIFLTIVQHNLFDGIKHLSTNSYLVHDYGSERALASRIQNQACVQGRV